ncbi:hypothetical protein CYLTODRAFT_419956 [Cylindrobasidium torrendii FP15055 ss-10]|uniref:Uncharacterized protein n=1 Tax=Cylindrobasidium torrendii FP15055 ss-10 TaxID=1314674 RepID=A0A0D7BJ43_9AGAR|nr:hypothetical protein CYLTODRAFT_419956 [Cylindrobasidium torrendii FP15055 ss-10]
MDNGAEGGSVVGGLCAIFCISNLAVWCNTKSYGDGGNSTAGCCGPCCNKSFDEDGFDAAVKKDADRNRDSNTPMKPSEPMVATPVEVSKS